MPDSMNEFLYKSPVLVVVKNFRIFRFYLLCQDNYSVAEMRGNLNYLAPNWNRDGN